MPAAKPKAKAKAKKSAIKTKPTPRGASLSIYGMYPDQPEAQAILKTLGKHKSSRACVYINKLEDVDLKVLETFIKAGVASMKKVSKEKGWPLEGT